MLDRRRRRRANIQTTLVQQSYVFPRGDRYAQHKVGLSIAPIPGIKEQLNNGIQTRSRVIM